jgi:SAM-dependent methyltransferase
MRNLVEPETADRAGQYWIERAETTSGALAVVPNGARHRRYHEWTQRLQKRWVLSRLDRARYRRIVDLGCGLGDWLELFAPRADEIHGCDVAPGFVATARSRLAAIDHRAWRVDCADLRSYTIPRGIELAHLGGVLTYLPDLWALRTLRRVRDAAAPGALVIIRDYCTFNFGIRSVNHETGYSVHRSPREIIELAASVGLRLLEARSSPSIYAEVMGNAVTRWPLALAWRLSTLYWLRASHSFVFRV